MLRALSAIGFALTLPAAVSAQHRDLAVVTIANPTAWSIDCSLAWGETRIADAFTLAPGDHVWFAWASPVPVGSPPAPRITFDADPTDGVIARTRVLTVNAGYAFGLDAEGLLELYPFPDVAGPGVGRRALGESVRQAAREPHSSR
jgi:hypothetical protein